ncbi:Uncharacterised protein [Salmonella enterica subsp. enterica serovar Bovismorbificans]|uniref:Uncharacterized protein n=2 Tax=Salmonella enterica I TaxID=59201 RepID=M7RHV9_SALDU|nr:hypothetical protein A670_03503 [Salmonella enterica subsp. enterica serovar Dublin str. UC16]EPI72980.1 hypothetical protein A671_01333 [Salmonella enterica subsp. enterica serovar Dublin str. DG22]CNT63667.1 Uncharacterised protein [Salmonella enterica subsp. enterica serovar Bovismorbificans]CPR41651.1 Uncharacterised protein [Salmonella enterica subsp. enterica serovar Bovismorbificans]
MRITFRVPNRFTSQAEQRIPLIEPIESPNKTAPISAVETERISRIAGVRVAQEAISSPGKKKNINSAQVRRFKALREERTVIASGQKIEARGKH